MPSLELFDDFVEVPGEGQDVGVLLLRELSVDAKSGILVLNINLGILFSILRHNCRI